MIIGGIVTGIISHGFKILTNTLFPRYDDDNISNGLMLLSSANAMWVLGALIKDWFGQTPSIIAAAGLMIYYIVPTVFFIFSFGEFKKASGLSRIPLFQSSLLLCLLIGNLSWVLADLFGSLKDVAFRGESLFYLFEIFFFISSVCCFSIGVFQEIQRRIKLKIETE